MTKICSCCGKSLEESSYWIHKMEPPLNWGDSPKKDYLFHKCKQCCVKDVDIKDIETILPLFKDFNVPYIKAEWKRICQKYPDNPIPRYLALMRLCGYYCFEYKDSDMLNGVEDG